MCDVSWIEVVLPCIASAAGGGSLTVAFLAFSDRLLVHGTITAEAAWSGLTRDERQLLLNELDRKNVAWRNVAKALNMAVS